MRLRLVYSHSGSRNLAARARYWRNGWSKDKPNGICGRSIRVVILITPTKITVTKRAWKFMVTNMQCISHGTNGPRDATKNFLLFTAAYRTQAHNLGPITVGNAQIGSPKRVMTPAKKAHKHGTAQVRGSNASAKNAKRCGTTAEFWQSQAFHATASQAKAHVILLTA